MIFRKSNGFTLVELMVVVIIMGILAAVAFPLYGRFIEKGDLADAKTLLTTVNQNIARNKLELFNHSTGSNSSSEDDGSRNAITEAINEAVKASSTNIGNKFTFAVNDCSDVQCKKYYLYANPIMSGRQKAVWMDNNGMAYICEKRDISEVSNPAEDSTCEKN